MTDHDAEHESKRDAAASGPDASTIADLTTRAEAALAADDPHSYRELLEQAGAWPPQVGFSVEEMQTIAAGDQAALRSALERNAVRGAVDAAGTLIEEALSAHDPVDAARWVEAIARFGDPDLMARLGRSMFAIGLLADSFGEDAAAVAWYERAADSGDVYARTTLGFRAWNADQTEAARRWFEQAAAGDDPVAMFALAGLALDDGDREAERAWYERAAALDHSNAMTNLGLIHRENNDAEGARRWFAAAAERGCAGGALILMLDDETRLDTASALAERVDGALDDELENVLEECDLANGATVYAEDALTEAGKALIEAGRPEAGQPLLRAGRDRYEQRARDDDTEAMLNLARLLQWEGDPKGARVLLERAAASGDELAAADLATLDRDGSTGHGG